MFQDSDMALLDPKTDLTFKRVFAENPELLIDLLNAILPLHENITDLEYLPTELLPQEDGQKLSIVDVRCTDQAGRHFVVEMQVVITPNLKNRMLFNAAKVLAKQLKASAAFTEIKSVYTLCFLEGEAVKGSDEWFHHYTINHNSIPGLVMEGMEWVYVELGKWRKLGNFNNELKRDLWLGFLAQPEKLNDMLTLEHKKKYLEVSKALEMINTSNYTDAQIRGMEKYVEDYLFLSTGIEMAIQDARKEALVEGKQRGIEEGKQEGLILGQSEALHKIKLVIEQLNKGIPVEKIAADLCIEISMVEEIKQMTNS